MTAAQAQGTTAAPTTARAQYRVVTCRVDAPTWNADPAHIQNRMAAHRAAGYPERAQVRTDTTDMWGTTAASLWSLARDGGTVVLEPIGKGWQAVATVQETAAAAQEAATVRTVVCEPDMDGMRAWADAHGIDLPTDAQATGTDALPLDREPRRPMPARDVAPCDVCGAIVGNGVECSYVADAADGAMVLRHSDCTPTDGGTVWDGSAPATPADLCHRCRQAYGAADAAWCPACDGHRQAVQAAAADAAAVQAAADAAAQEAAAQERASLQAMADHIESRRLPADGAAQARATLAQVRATGAACTAVVHAGTTGSVTVWAGDDADLLQPMAHAGIISLQRMHIGCSAHTSHDAAAGTDRPRIGTATRMAIDCNGRPAIVQAMADTIGVGVFPAVGMFDGQVLPSMVANVRSAEDVTRLHAALRMTLPGYGCAAVMAPAGAR